MITKLGPRLKKYRESHEWSQEALAACIPGVTKANISQWENSIRVPSARHLISLARELEIGVDCLLGTHRSPCGWPGCDAKICDS